MPLLSVCVWAFPLIAGGVIARYIFRKFVIPVLWSPIENIPGPITASFWGSNLLPLFDSKNSWTIHERFVQRYGRTLRVFGIAKFDQRILSLDPTVIGHILNRPAIYQKPWQSRAFISAIIGESLFSSEGAKHRRQRRIADQAFREKNLQTFLPVVFSKASELTEKWISLVERSEATTAVIDISNWIHRLTMDVIGQVGFGVDIGALQDEDNELHVCYKQMFNSLLKKQSPFLTFIGMCFPKLQPWIPTDMFITLTRCKKVVNAFGTKLLEQKRCDLQHEEKCKARDFLTLFLKANSQCDIAPDQRMSDQEILDMINTMLNAGTDTTALALIWSLHLLSKHPEAQIRLREEAMTVPIYSPSQVCSDEEMVALFNQIDNLPYLDAVLKETLRLSPSVHSTLRVAMVDDEIPLSEEMKMRDGSVEKVFKVKQGQWIHIPLEASNIDRAVWGEDAWEFKPERWECLPETVSALPGAYSNLLTFSAGPRVCIGMRFAHMELKVALHQIISCLSFRSAANIIKGTLTLSRPYVEQDWKEGRTSSCPMYVSRYLPDEAACT